MGNDTIVSTARLTKAATGGYRVRDLNLRVGEGEIYGFLGPNGAGKSTTLKMLLGLAKPTSGQITIFDQELAKHRQPILSRIGSLIESPSYYGHLTGLENMRVMQRLRGVAAKQISEALRTVRLEQHQHKRVDHYSLGMKQRLGIAMALLASPKLLILDEPTNGLDPAGIGEIRELIKSLPGRYGMTVLLSSHLLSEIEQIATSVGIIHHGELLFQGSMEELRAMGQPQLSIKTEHLNAAYRLLQSKGIFPEIRNGRLYIKLLSDELAAGLNRMLVENGFPVIRLEEHGRSLEELFLELTGGERSL